VAARRRSRQTKADAKAATEPSVRVFTTWTPALIRVAELQANAGNLRQAADLCEWLLGDERVASTLQTRTDALLGLDPTFESSGDKRRSRRVVKALEGQEDWWEAYPESELSLMLKWGILLGLSAAQHNPDYREGHGGRLLPLPEFWHPQHVRYDSPTRRWLTRVASDGNVDTGVEIELVPGDGTWLLHTPYGKNRPWAWGLWRGLSRLVLLKYFAISDWARHSEKASLLVGTTHEEVQTSRQQRAELASDLYNRGREGVVVLPAGFDLKLVETTANTKQIYDAQIEMVNTAIAVAIRGGNLTTEVQGGSRAAAESQERLGDKSRLRFDAQSLTTTIHDQSLIWWAQWNFGDANLAPWPVYPVEPKRDLKVRADVANVAADAAQKYVDLGFEVDRKKFAEEFELAEWLKPGSGIPPTPPVPAQPDSGAPPPAPLVTPATDDDNREGPPAEEQGSAAARRHGIRLASGASAAANSGFVDGQLYVDALVERSAEHGADALGPDLETVLRIVGDAKDYDDLRQRLRDAYRDMSPERLSSLVERAMVLGELAGRTAVLQDL
jgi:phage gp29-like protein